LATPDPIRVTEHGSSAALLTRLRPEATAMALAVAIVLAGLLTDPEIAIRFLVLVPLLAAALGASPRGTAAIGVMAVVTVVVIGATQGFFGTTEHIAPLGTATGGSLIAYYLAGVRVEREHDQRRLEVQFRVARTLQESATIEEAAPQLLESIGTALGWQLGGLWQVHRSRVLRCVESWYAPGVDSEGFEQLSRQFVLRPGVGLPGRVWESGRTSWVSDVTLDRELPRAELAAKASLRGAVGFPLRTSAGVVGVLEFFAREVREPDPSLLELIDALGGQIGEFIEVQAAGAALRESEARKTAMFDAALDCVITIDAEGSVIEFNPAAQATFGYSAEEARGREMAELIVPPDMRDAHRHALKRCVETGESDLLGQRLELRGMNADGREFPIELTISRIGHESPPTFTGFLRDITDRLSAEAERERLLEAERLSRGDADRARGQLAAILSGVADAVTAQGADGRLLFANEAAVKRLGMKSEHELLEAAPGELVSRYEFYDDAGDPFQPDRLPGRRALAGEEAPEAVLRQVDPDTGEQTWTLVKATPIHDETGAVVMAINVVEDITALKRAEQSQRLLADAGGVLASPLHDRGMLERVVELTVPVLADWCAIHLLDVAGDTGVAAQHATDPEFAEEMAETAKRFPPDDGGDLVRAMEPHPGVVVPVASGRTVLGAMVLARRGTGRAYRDDDVRVAEELGRRVGSALDNARLYAERSHIARTLQESMLPAQLPDIPGLETAARFRAAGDGNEVGGDFYDLFQGAGDSWSVVMGDVCGKGPDAAAVTALARYTLRAAAMSRPGPSAGLHMLNDALLRQRGDLRFATVAYASVVPDGQGARLAVASAGHPLPLLLRRDGTVESVGEGGTLAGVVPDPDIVDRSERLDPGDALVFYTDGVSEARDENGILGEARLRQILEECVGMGPEGIATRIEREAVDRQRGETRDDIAVVVLRASSHPEPDVD
jgi:PAS domain S-box-containing protein